MSKTHLLLTFLLIHQQPTVARAIHSNYSTNRMNCILHDYPTKQYCDLYFPNRYPAQVYHKNEEGILISWLIMMIIVFVVYICACL